MCACACVNFIHTCIHVHIVSARACLCARVRAGVCLHMASRYTPRAAEYLPASQLSHAVLTPVVVLYFPAWQSSHAVLMPAKGLCFPATHSSHMAEPALAWYLPAPQASQAVLTPEEALYLPALHSSARHICGVCMYMFVCGIVCV